MFISSLNIYSDSIQEPIKKSHESDAACQPLTAQEKPHQCVSKLSILWKGSSFSFEFHKLGKGHVQRVASSSTFGNK